MNTTRLLDSFPPATIEAWQRIAQAEIGDLLLEQLISPTAEGIDRQPIYWPEHLHGIAALTSVPGQAPFVRGTHARHPADGPWLICQSIRAADPATANTLGHTALQQGATALQLAPVDSDGLRTTLAGIDPSAIGLFISCQPHTGLHLAQALAALVGQHKVASLHGGIGCDPSPIANAEPQQRQQSLVALAELTTWASEQAPQIATIHADGIQQHEAGANATQELGHVLARAVQQIRALSELGLAANITIPHVRFQFALGSQMFIEIAKLRAARVLWAQIATAFGIQPDLARVTIHACSALRGSTTTEPHTNLLRGTIATFAAALGGVDSLEVTPFDAGFRMPDPFSLRMALNTQHLLHEESQFGQVIDPAGGSWYIEALTDQLARKAWAFFQELEKL
jgi:methylmalonyl-CoA mutase